MRAQLEKAIWLLRMGDAESVESALQLVHQTIFSFGMKICGQREDAEDTAQEVLFKSLPHLAHLEESQALSTWLYKAARNRCWEGRRKASFRREIALQDLMPDGSEVQALLADSVTPDPEQLALRRADFQTLHKAILRLPPQYRIVLVLHDMEELDTDAVAKILSLRPGTVRVRLHRARLLARQEVNKLSNRFPGKISAKATEPSTACRQVFANLSEYLDGRLTAESCDRIRSHINGCPGCVAFIQDLKQAIDRCRSLEICSENDTPSALRRLLTDEYLRLIGHSG